MVFLNNYLSVPQKTIRSSYKETLKSLRWFEIILIKRVRMHLNIMKKNVTLTTFNRRLLEEPDSSGIIEQYLFEFVLIPNFIPLGSQINNNNNK